MQPTCIWGQLFRRSKSLLGLGPESLRVGDKVVIVTGSDVPLILRPVVGKPKSSNSLAKHTSVRLCMERHWDFYLERGHPLKTSFLYNRNQKNGTQPQQPPSLSPTRCLGMKTTVVRAPQVMVDLIVKY